MDSVIQQIDHYPADSIVCLVKTYPLEVIYLVYGGLHPLNYWTLDDSVIQPSRNNRGQVL